MLKRNGQFSSNIYKRNSARKINACLEKEFLQILVINSALESSGLKIYDFFNMVYHNKITVPLCYKTLANVYIFLERSLGDPHLSLRKLSEILLSGKISSFLREYADVLISTGDTQSYVDSILREEMARIRARISEIMRFIDILYESILVLTIGFSLILIMPFINIPFYITQLSIIMTGLVGYMIASYILHSVDMAIPQYITIIDMAYIISLCILITSKHGILIHGLLILPLYTIARKESSNIFKLEKASLSILHNVYSNITLNVPIDKALSTSLEKQNLREFKLIHYYFSMGLDTSKVLHYLKLPSLTRKILCLINTPLLYSDWRGQYVFRVTRIFDYLNDIRKYIAERAKSYVIYSMVLTSLILISYVLISRSDIVISSDILNVLYAHGYLGFLSMYIPASLLKDRGLTSSSISLLLISFISCITYLLIFL